MALSQIAEQIGVPNSTLAEQRRNLSEADFLELLSQKTGARWRFDSLASRYGKYYSVSDTSNLPSE